MAAMWWRILVETHRALVILSYPIGFVICMFEHSRPTIPNAQTFYTVMLTMWTPGTIAFRYKSFTADISWYTFVIANFLWLYFWDYALLSFTTCAMCTESLYKRPETTNRLFNKKPGDKLQWKGKKICVLGNGPSLAKGKPCGSVIDSMDEVVRFNNFQTRNSGLGAWTGSKCTVHFSDSMLYPSYEEYAVPDATVCLSLFMDRLAVSGSYFLFRLCMDLEVTAVRKMMFTGSLGWLSHADIHDLKDLLGISKWKHPTSGILAIDWFVRNRPDPSVPVYIHGFDFFQGPTIHYYSKTEPLYERLNDLLGVTMMHEPFKEKAYVEKLVEEGKVAWLVPPEKKQAAPVPMTQSSTQRKVTFAGMIWNVIVTANRLMITLSYPLAAVFIRCNHSPTTQSNARAFFRTLLCLFLVVSGTFYYYMWFMTEEWDMLKRCIAHFFWFWMVDVPLFWSITSTSLCERIISRERCTNRLFDTVNPKHVPQFNGPNVVILGNGPSLAKGEKHSKIIDSMDEVVRFNNFQARQGDLEAWTGTKTTVHFSDGMLYPSFPEYEVPGACVVLSLFMDRLMVSISYLLFRMGLDLAVWQAWSMMNSPRLGWVPQEDIQNLKKKLGISHGKQPTSGALAIDWFVRHRPNKDVPIYIHGFDFFQGKQTHYYDKTEPLYERLNTFLGVTMMHEPSKEVAWVDTLVKEGKVKWLQDLAREKNETH